MSAYHPDFVDFLRDGYLVLSGLIARAEAAAWHDRCEIEMGRDPALRAKRDDVAEQGQFATMIPSEHLGFLAPLIGHRGAFDALVARGFTDLVYWKSNLISKPPGARRLPWHQDGMLWHDPRAYAAEPTQLFLMWYLCDTDRDNGCLRVIPGSHRRRHPLHDAGTAHDADFYDVADRTSIRLRDDPAEVDVAMRAGDLLVGDARLLHASHGNHSERWRPLVTVWYFSFFSELQPDSQAFVRREYHNRQRTWEPEAMAHIAHLAPPPAQAPVAARTCRTPGPAFR